MKIIAAIPVSYGTPGAVVQLSGEELNRILGGERYRTDIKIEAGTEVQINKKFDKAMDVLDKAYEAKSIPHILRALAKTIEASQDIVDVITEDETKKDVP